eukprot:TRINITY_DN2458_c0_g1_i1.p1 TRINITY_DN2458_c0_g1~~TRINITY_DN2458_c0_g1_i1.p1  ORF type:complete len:108 (-),score=20.29 TRINITY_DN2458_c0_g1_i1:470-793(-)
MNKLLVKKIIIPKNLQPNLGKSFSFSSSSNDMIANRIFIREKKVKELCSNIAFFASKFIIRLPSKLLQTTKINVCDLMIPIPFSFTIISNLLEICSKIFIIRITLKL